MLNHVFLSVNDIECSIAFYTQALAPLGSPIASIMTARTVRRSSRSQGFRLQRARHLSGCGYAWSIGGSAHVGFVAKSRAEVDAAYATAMAAGATDNGKPSAPRYYDPRYYAGNVFDPDGYSLEFVFKSWSNPQP